MHKNHKLATILVINNNRIVIEFITTIKTQLLLFSRGETKMTEVDFKVVLLKDETISEQGRLDTEDADSERPIRWMDYGWKWFFPNNPFDPDWQIADYNRHQELRNAVLTDDLLIQYLVDFADEENVEILRGKYKLLINY